MRLAARPSAALAGLAAFMVTAFAVPAHASPMTTSSQANDQLFSAIDSDLRDQMLETGLPGMSVGIVRGDAIVHLQGFGDADDSGRVVTPRTPFAIGSLTKSFTALAVVQLVEAGHVDLDTPVLHYLPRFQLSDPEASGRITVRQLLNQTSGIPATSDYMNHADDSTTALQDAVSSFQYLALDRPPGSGFEYSNANYTTLGLLVATVSGQTYEQYIADNVLTPLGMSNSYMSVPQARQHGLAIEHHYWFGWPFPGGGLPYNRATTPAGLISSDATDMSRYLLAQLAAGRYPGGRVLSPAGIAQLHQGDADIGGSDAYAMGWVDSIGSDGQRFSWHNGDTQGSQAYMAVMPATGWGVVLLSNGSNDLRPTDVDAIARRVMARLLGVEPAPLPDFEEGTYTLVLLVMMAALALQAGGIVRSAVLLRRWRTQPPGRPQGSAGIGARIAAPALLNLLWGLACLVVLPTALGQSLWAAVVDQPSDVGVAVAASGVLAVVWGAITRPVLAVLQVRSHRSPRPVTYRAAT